MPGVLELGIISPVVVLIIKPDNGGAGVPDVDVTAYNPPVYAPVPFNVAASVPITFVQNEAAEYEILAVGNGVIVTVAVAVTCAHGLVLGNV